MLTNFKRQLCNALLAFLWRQWSALGVAGQARTGDPWLIDPEALLLFSTIVARHDARLFDEILDWLQLNADALNLQRLARLQKDHALGDATVLAAMAAQITGGKAYPKWRTIVARTPAFVVDTPPRSLFPHLPVIGRGEATWLAWGWQRPPVELRGLSQAPRPDQPATFLFKLRALFGLQARAEVMAWLLTRETGHPAEIARATGYFRGSIQAVLNELSTSGHVFALRSGREKRFGLCHEEWRFLLTWSDAREFPRWMPWEVIFSLFQRLWIALEHPRLLGLSPAVQAIELDRALAPSIVSLSSVGLWKMPAVPLHGEAAIEANLNQVRILLNKLN